jgi:8-oxo-dGTP pyrophosphatase MutT (NUDIX family)
LERRLFLRDGHAFVILANRLRTALDVGMARSVDLIPRDSNVEIGDHTRVSAAVLIAVTDRPEPHIILTQRPDTMRKHPGQVAFPGGRVDADDVDVIAAALREAEEEVGLFAHQVQIIGTMDIYHTITGYEITPVIAVAQEDIALVANQDEVSAIFEVPLSFLLDARNHQTREVIWNGQPRHYYEMHWEGRRIWGATAAMIVNLSRRLQWLV